jgi:alkylation response protein AidB-like acyl-CoA dehydrogenase
MAAAEDLVPLIEEDAVEAERIFRQTDRVVTALRRTGIYAMLLPRALGGAELAFVEAMRIVERLSWADGSAGWCTMVANVQAASGGAHLPLEGARLVYGKGPDVSMAGQGVPSGRARRVEDGYVITGRWSYGSGIHHAEWVHSGCIVMDGDRPALDVDGAPEITVAHHPKSSITLLGNWDVLGLRGTGSFDYAIAEGELFVSASLCYPPDATTSHHGGRQYEIGLVGFTAWGHTGWALGVGRRILDELARLARERRDVFGRLLTVRPSRNRLPRLKPTTVRRERSSMTAGARSTGRRRRIGCRASRPSRSFALPCGTCTMCCRTSPPSPTAPRAVSHCATASCSAATAMPIPAPSTSFSPMRSSPNAVACWSAPPDRRRAGRCSR